MKIGRLKIHLLVIRSLSQRLKQGNILILAQEFLSTADLNRAAADKLPHDSITITASNNAVVNILADDSIPIIASNNAVVDILAYHSFK